MKNETQQLIAALLHKKTGKPVTSIQFSPVSGGSINNTYKITVNTNQRFFVKLNCVDTMPGLFQKEKNGLAFLGQQKIIRVPQVIAHDETASEQLLILEWIEGGIKTTAFWKSFGEQLAQLHQITNQQFGFYEDNYMGALIQDNLYKNKWTDFFTHNRLQPQVKLAASKQLLDAAHINLFERLYQKLDEYFNKEKPALLHGDLWRGNFMCSENAQPILIDPAVYFGHRSTDLAMTTLFGGFDKAFYKAYHYHSPFPYNYQEQWDICNLYPLLIHLNLFGSGYLSQIVQVLKRYA